MGIFLAVGTSTGRNNSASFGAPTILGKGDAVIELESHAKTKRSELPLGFGDAAKCVASYNPQTGLLSLAIADGDKHKYVMICTYADWQLLNQRVVAGLAFLHNSVDIPPATEGKTAATPEPPPAPAPEPTPEPATQEPAKQPARDTTTPRRAPMPSPATPAPAKAAPDPYFGKKATAEREAAAAAQTQESRGLPPLANPMPDEFDPVTGEILPPAGIGDNA